MDIHFTVPAAAADVLANPATLARKFDLLFQVMRQVPELATTVNVNGGSLDRVGTDQRTLQQLVRVVLHNLPIFERARLGLVGIDCDVLGAFDLGYEAPLHASREASAAATAQIGILDDLSYLI